MSRGTQLLRHKVMDFEASDSRYGNAWVQFLGELSKHVWESLAYSSAHKVADLHANRHRLFMGNVTIVSRILDILHRRQKDRILQIRTKLDFVDRNLLLSNVGPNLRIHLLDSHGGQEKRRHRVYGFRSWDFQLYPLRQHVQTPGFLLLQRFRTCYQVPLQCFSNTRIESITVGFWLILLHLGLHLGLGHAPRCLSHHWHFLPFPNGLEHISQSRKRPSVHVSTSQDPYMPSIYLSIRRQVQRHQTTSVSDLLLQDTVLHPHTHALLREYRHL